uniref:Uncharacterized protein n=1 Tax=Mucochytrium quahogii TaxID=96639 RepID=A0A7S2RZH2_9STRA|mmetsp:Transcript_19509/g.32567  ORF Transcript_19509/g.32567 Transcript_19509/m.32567 type:complete len:264 (+) Transcript_19509:146-937(+)
MKVSSLLGICMFMQLTCMEAVRMRSRGYALQAVSTKNNQVSSLEMQALEGTTTSERCQQVYDQDMATGAFSECDDEQNVQGQNGVNCSEFTSYDSCSEKPECWWWHLANPNDPQCLANPCYRINNGQCTIQATGGRCVWYTAEQNLALRGIDNPGCYKSPCSNPTENNSTGCAAVQNEFYSCEWCKKHDGQAYGCVNAKNESMAQCWNIGQSDKCNNCLGDLGYTATCPTETCQSECCESPLCTCIKSDSRDPDDVAVPIGNS